MIAAAGTGGHIYPGLSVADYFKSKNFKISWLGTPKGMENHLVDKKSIEFIAIKMEGIRGKGLIRWFKLPFLLSFATFQAIAAIRRLKPSVILLMGGYISAPVAIAAKFLGIHLIIHEQNALVGMSNRVMSKIANICFSGFKTNLKNMQEIGNPIREEIYSIKNPSKRFEKRKGALRILVLGGSLGAQQFNIHLPKIFELVNKTKKIIIIHQSGEKHYDELIKNYASRKLKVEIKEFIHDMNNKYEWADLIIARSGALTVSEICEAGIASILVPYPYAVDNHQLFNAKIIELRRGGYIVEQENMATKLVPILLKITRKECMRKAVNAKSKKRQNPAEQIYNYCMKMVIDEK